MEVCVRCNNRTRECECSTLLCPRYVTEHPEEEMSHKPFIILDVQSCEFELESNEVLTNKAPTSTLVQGSSQKNFQAHCLRKQPRLKFTDPDQAKKF